MPKIRMLDSIIGEDRQDWFAGTVQDASKPYADYCVRRGIAVFVDPDEQLAPHPPLTADAITNRAEVPEHRDPAPRPTGGRRRR